METSSLMPPKARGRSRYFKALPKPPSFDSLKKVVLPVRKDSLPSGPPPPPKDTIVRPTKSSTVASTKLTKSPLLPPVPALTRINSPPTAIPKRKPVGSGSSTKSPPPPQPIRGDDMSPVESLYSLPIAPGPRALSATRSSGEIASPKDSFRQASPQKVLRKKIPGGPTAKPVSMPPLSISTPVSSSKMEKDRSPSSSKALPSVPGDPLSTSPKSQSPPQGQLWRRRSVKTDKALSVAELKLETSHGSTAASSHQPGSSSPHDSSLSKPMSPSSGLDLDSPILNFSGSAHRLTIRPSVPNQSSPRSPPTELEGNEELQDDLDGFSQYAQDLEDGYTDHTYNATDLSPARSPEIRRPPTPEYEKDENRDYAAENLSPAFPITPPSDARPLSMIPEDFVKNTISSSAAVGPPPSGPLPALPPRTSSRSSPSPPAAPRQGAPRRPVSSGRATPVAASPVASPAYGSRPSSSLGLHEQGPRPAFAPSMTISDYGSAWASSPTASTITTTNNNYAPADKSSGANTPASPGGDADYYPTPEFSRVFNPGDVLPAPPLKETQLDCFSGHALFTFSKNEAHPVACMACLVQDRGTRLTCSHCSARLCSGCRDALVANGKDLRGLVAALRG